ncbi:hypothetical protein [Paucibacter sp. Y2R2-4]|uniref:lysine 5,6-aminomutase reactivase subunit KamB n=1 Tax=Paucibacter sp. Y2R2-4 TaxID=2893553 RepID=UPI0021E439DA|nr:hypothetical protein [Paucibacter sp. Y2R2-4]MCV2349920.1 hypothetical protein [Paucibacter sp. Y2R2-4]
MDMKVIPNSSCSQSSLWQRIRKGQIETLAVMGMAKNTGKTVALNHVLAEAHAAQVPVGVTSIGRDGEDRDQVFLFPKPPVLIWPGSLVATARDTLARAKLKFKLLGGTGMDSPMGEIVIVKALEYGEMEIAGASRSSDQLKIIHRLKQAGCELVVLDGALGRSHHASPAIADGVILATGAALGGGIGDVIRKTGDRLAILGLPQVPAEVGARVQDVFARGGVALWDGQGRLLYRAEIASLNAASVLLAYAEHDVGTIAVSGAVGRLLWKAMSQLAALRSGEAKGLQIVVADGTKLFVDALEVQALARSGGQLFGYRSIRILGLTLNPFSPMGGSFEGREFLLHAREAFSGYDVSDVVLESGAAQEIKQQVQQHSGDFQHVATAT